MTPLGRTALVGTARRGGDAWDVLLAAGTRSVQARAGFTAEPRRVEVAPPDARDACGADAAAVLRQLFGGRHAEVLPEALDRLDALGLRLPHALLPLALRCELHDRVGRVLDRRGEWLAARHPDGGWVVPSPGEDELEAALGGRAVGARRDAAYTLATRGGRLADAMWDRARGLVRWDGDRVVADIPTVDPAWARDALHGKAPAGMGEGAWALVQTLTLVRPSRWALGAPAEVVAAIGPDQGALAEGLARAAVLFRDPSWAGPLWAWWRRRAAGGAHLALRDALAGCCDVDPVALGDADALDTLEAARRPWSVPFGRAFLAALLRRVEADDTTWVRAARCGAVGLPPALLGDALAPWPIRAGRTRWHEAREAWVATVRVRQRLVEVLPDPR